MNIHTVSARLAAALVALVAGAASFSHIADVAIGAGERVWVGYSLPLAVDGLIVVGVAALLEDRREGRLGRRSARLAVAVGVLATLAANIASAEPTWTARLVAVAAPVSFLLAVEVLTRTGRPAANAGYATQRGMADRTDLYTPTRENAVRATQSARKAATPTSVRAKPARKSTGERVAAAVARTPDATPAQLASRLKVSERTVTRYLPSSKVVPGNLRTPADLEPSPNGAGS